MELTISHFPFICPSNISLSLPSFRNPFSRISCLIAIHPWTYRLYRFWDSKGYFSSNKYSILLFFTLLSIPSSYSTLLSLVIINGFLLYSSLDFTSGEQAFGILESHNLSNAAGTKGLIFTCDLRINIFQNHFYAIFSMLGCVRIMSSSPKLVISIPVMLGSRDERLWEWQVCSFTGVDSLVLIHACLILDSQKLVFKK